MERNPSYFYAELNGNNYSGKWDEPEHTPKPTPKPPTETQTEPPAPPTIGFASLDGAEIALLHKKKE